MHFKKIAACILLLVNSIPGLPCSTFFINHDGQMVFGRNYDWMADSGMVCTNLHGMAKTSSKTADGKPISWVAKYGSITFNQYGKEFPTGGMNEKGLVVELMWLDETVYPKPDERPAIDALQWIQYQLDNHKNIEEVIASDKLLRISSSDAPLHYMVADASGHTAAIEFLGGKMIVHGRAAMPQPVLTNDSYARSLVSYNRGSSAGNNSLQRFSTACSMIENFKANPGKKSLIDYSFSILDKIAQGNYTKWSIVYDISNMTIWFKTEKFRQLRSISFSSFDFACAGSSKMIDMNRPEKGDIHSLFNNYSASLNHSIVTKTLEQSKATIQLTKEQTAAIFAYPATISCK